ncbi:SH3 domain-containing protein [Frigidibacter sp. MR17.14]|uniref:SH3 domain-containing protein n=1 Tax=Frigidibacter sp. MR17.14 TaxID=3126509 RepID=UPI003012B184
MKLVALTVIGMLLVATIWGRPPEGGRPTTLAALAKAPAPQGLAPQDDERSALKALIANVVPATPAVAATSTAPVIPAVAEAKAAAAPMPAAVVLPARSAPKIVATRDGLPVLYHPDDAVAVPVAASAGATEPGRTGYVTGKRVNFREAPTTGAAVVDTLGRGEAVTLVGAPEGGWQKIRIEGSGGEGWMSSKFLSDTPPA